MLKTKEHKLAKLQSVLQLDHMGNKVHKPIVHVQTSNGTTILPANRPFYRHIVERPTHDSSFHTEICHHVCITMRIFFIEPIECWS
jgi:hypothetical protein